MKMRRELLDEASIILDEAKGFMRASPVILLEEGIMQIVWMSPEWLEQNAATLWSP